MKKLLAVILAMLLSFSLVFSMVACGNDRDDDDDDDDTVSFSALEGNLESLGYYIENEPAYRVESQNQGINIAYGIDVTIKNILMAEGENGDIVIYEFETAADAKEFSEKADPRDLGLGGDVVTELNGNVVIVATSSAVLKDAFNGSKPSTPNVPSNPNYPGSPSTPSNISMDSIESNLDEAGYMSDATSDSYALNQMSQVMKQQFNIDVTFKSMVEASDGSNFVSVYETASASQAQLVADAAKSSGVKSYVVGTIVIVASSDTAVNDALYGPTSGSDSSNVNSGYGSNYYPEYDSDYYPGYGSNYGSDYYPDYGYSDYPGYGSNYGSDYYPDYGYSDYPGYDSSYDSGWCTSTSNPGVEYPDVDTPFSISKIQNNLENNGISVSVTSSSSVTSMYEEAYAQSGVYVDIVSVLANSNGSIMAMEFASSYDAETIYDLFAQMGGQYYVYIEGAIVVTAPSESDLDMAIYG
jgi:hypothetical protein